MNLKSGDIITALQDWQSSGLRVASIFRSFIVTLPSSTNMILIGQLTDRDWQGVRGCIKIAFAELDDLC